MCRLATFKGISDDLELAWAFTELELSFGGHGNGLYTSADNSLEKGVGKDGAAAKLAKIAAKKDNADAVSIFHTRLASCGGIRDEVCHPHRANGKAGQFIVAHNGHWAGWIPFPGATDTIAMARLIADHGVGILRDSSAAGSGMWLVWSVDHQQMLMCNRGGSFVLTKLEDEKENKGRFFHASEPVLALSRQVISQVRFESSDVVWLMDDEGDVAESDVERVRMPDRPSYSSRSYGRGSTYRPGRGWTKPDDKKDDKDDDHLPGWVRRFVGHQGDGFPFLVGDLAGALIDDDEADLDKDIDKRLSESDRGDVSDINDAAAEGDDSDDDDDDEMYYCRLVECPVSGMSWACYCDIAADYVCKKCQEYMKQMPGVIPDLVDEVKWAEVEGSVAEGDPDIWEEIIGELTDEEFTKELKEVVEKEKEFEARILAEEAERARVAGYSCLRYNCDEPVDGCDWYCPTHSKEATEVLHGIF